MILAETSIAYDTAQGSDAAMQGEPTLSFAVTAAVHSPRASRAGAACGFTSALMARIQGKPTEDSPR